MPHEPITLNFTSEWARKAADEEIHMICFADISRVIPLAKWEEEES